MTTTCETGLLGPVELVDLAGAPVGRDVELATWHAAFVALVDGLTAADFGGGSVGKPVTVEASVPGPLFSAWFGPGASGVQQVADGITVVAQTARDETFLGSGVLMVLAANQAGSWHPRAMTLPVADVVARYLRPDAGPAAGGATEPAVSGSRDHAAGRVRAGRHRDAA